MHKVVAGVTLHSIAKKYEVWEDQLLADNKGIQLKEAGSGQQHHRKTAGAGADLRGG